MIETKTKIAKLNKKKLNNKNFCLQTLGIENFFSINLIIKECIFSQSTKTLIIVVLYKASNVQEIPF